MKLCSRRMVVVGLFMLFSSWQQFLHARTWTQAASGRTVEAELVKVSGDNVVLKLRNGRTASVPISTLSKADQAYLKESVRGSPPAGVPTGQSGEWPAFRGADGTGISPGKGLLRQWQSEGPKQLWVFRDSGMGYSGFSIANGKLYTMGSKRRDIHMVCINPTNGSLVWSKAIADDEKGGYNIDWGHGPRSTPAYSEGRVYGLSPTGDLVCVDAITGSKLWQKHLVRDFDGEPSGWGYSESPLIDGQRLIICPGGNRNGIIALNKQNGETIWKAEQVRPGRAEYSTAVLATINKKRQYIRFFEKAVYGVDAENGKLLWQGDFPKGTLAVVPTPVVSGNQVYVSAGYNAGCKAYKIDADFSVREMWTNDIMGNHHGGVIKFGDYLYGFDDGKGLICQDWHTGRLVWMEKDRRNLAKGAIHIADGMIVALNEQNGAVTLVAATPEGYSEKGQFVVEPQSRERSRQGRIWTHPVVAGGRLFLRDQELIHCYLVK